MWFLNFTIKAVVIFIISAILLIGILLLLITSRPTYYECNDGRCITLVDYYQGGGNWVRIYDGIIFSRFLLDKRAYALHILEDGEFCINKKLVDGKIVLYSDQLPYSQTKPLQNVTFVKRAAEGRLHDQCLDNEINFKTLFNLPLIL